MFRIKPSKEAGSEEWFVDSMRNDKTKQTLRDFPGGAVVKNLPANAGDMGLSLVREDPTC